MTDKSGADPIAKRWSGLCVVAATGPSLTPEVAELCRGHRVIAVNDAYRLMPWADTLYACDVAWWHHHKGCPEFAGEKVISVHDKRHDAVYKAARCYGLSIVAGKPGDTFSLDPQTIHYGFNSGFQAINLAILRGASPVVLVGFDFRGSHFFGEHPRPPLKNNSIAQYTRWLEVMRNAAKHLPAEIQIINCTPGSAIDCFPMGDLREVLDGAEARHAA
jgi:hypothetical protein